MAIVTIQEYIVDKKSAGMDLLDIAKHIGISKPMVSQYANHDYKASWEVALHVYKLDGVALHPFSGESLQYELDKRNK